MADEKNLQAEESKAAEVKEAPKAEKKSEKKPNFFVSFAKKTKKLFRDVVGEMKKVVWLSKEETKKSSILVVVTVIVIAAAIGVIDTAFSSIINFVAGLIG